MRAIGISLSHHNTRLLAAQWRKISFAFVRSSGSTLNFKRFGSGLERRLFLPILAMQKLMVYLLVRTII